MAQPDRGDDRTSVFVTHSIDTNGHGHPDFFLTRQLSDKEAESLDVAFLAMLAIGIVALAC